MIGIWDFLGSCTCTSAELSKMLTSIMIIPSCCGTNDSKHSTKIDLFFAGFIILFDANYGGHACCSCWKNASKSLSLAWLDMDIIDNSWTSFCRLDILEVDFAGVFSEPEVDRGKLCCVWGHSMQRQILYESLTCILPMSSDVCLVSGIITLVSSVYGYVC